MPITTATLHSANVTYGDFSAITVNRVEYTPGYFSIPAGIYRIEWNGASGSNDSFQFNFYGTSARTTALTTTAQPGTIIVSLRNIRTTHGESSSILYVDVPAYDRIYCTLSAPSFRSIVSPLWNSYWIRVG